MRGPAPLVSFSRQGGSHCRGPRAPLHFVPFHSNIELISARIGVSLVRGNRSVVASRLGGSHCLPGDRQSVACCTCRASVLRFSCLAFVRRLVSRVHSLCLRDNWLDSDSVRQSPRAFSCSTCHRSTDRLLISLPLDLPRVREQDWVDQGCDSLCGEGGSSSFEAPPAVAAHLCMSLCRSRVRPNSSAWM